MTGIASLRRTWPHGTRPRYVKGCRCKPCTAANAAAYRDRMARQREGAASLTPSGPPIVGTLRRGGHDDRILRCPGANGASCIRGGAWLRGKQICGACIERATVWDGLIDAAPVRAHLAALSAQGVGYKAVAAATDVGKSTLSRIVAGEATRVRAQIARRVLEATADAISDGALVDGAETNARIASLRARGFTLRHLARLMGQTGSVTMLALGQRARCTARTRAIVERVWKRAERGDLRPERAHPEAPEAHAFVQACLAAGLSERWLTNAIGVHVHHADTPRMRPAKAAAILGWRDRIREELEHGLPDGWNLANASALADAFSWGGGWRVSGLSRGEAPKKRTKRKRPQLTPEQKRERSRQKQRDRRAAMGREAVRAENLRHQRAKRAREREERQQAA